MTWQHLLLAWVLPDLILWGSVAVVLVALARAGDDDRGRRK